MPSPRLSKRPAETSSAGPAPGKTAVSATERPAPEFDPPPRRGGWLLALIAVMRPKQWTKNLLLFAGLLFTLDHHHSIAAYGRAALGFALFSLLAGVTYIVNDIVDVESDRQHPKKRFRPIAYGDLSIPVALGAGLLIGSLAIGLAFLELGWKFGTVSVVYVVLTLAYSFSLKHIVILDLLALALGFVLRAVAGAWAIPVGISQWLVLCTLLLALFLGIAKRRGELIAVQNGRRGGRPILTEYSSDMLDQMTTIVTSALVMSYALYTIQSPAALKHHYLMATIPFVIYGIFRYLYLIHRQGLGESPDEVIIKDRPLLACVLLWAMATALIVVKPFWH